MKSRVRSHLRLLGFGCASAMAAVVAAAAPPTGAATTVFQHVPSGTGATAFSAPGEPAVSSNGTYVAFAAIPGATPSGLGVTGSNTAIPAVYVYDRLHNKVRLIAMNADTPSITADGRFVAYRKVSDGPNTRGVPIALDVFDQRTGRTRTAVPCALTGRISADGTTLVASYTGNCVTPSGKPPAAFAAMAGSCHCVPIVAIHQNPKVVRPAFGTPAVLPVPATVQQDGVPDQTVSSVSGNGRFVALQGENSPTDPAVRVLDLVSRHVVTIAPTPLPSVGDIDWYVSPVLDATGTWVAYVDVVQGETAEYHAHNLVTGVDVDFSRSQTLPDDHTGVDKSQSTAQTQVECALQHCSGWYGAGTAPPITATVSVSGNGRYAAFVADADPNDPQAATHAYSAVYRVDLRNPTAAAVEMNGTAAGTCATATEDACVRGWAAAPALDGDGAVMAMLTDIPMSGTDTNDGEQSVYLRIGG